MKQAYTNTIRGGGRNNPLTIATNSKKGRSSKQQLPKCAYGSACTRKGCAYRHPSADSPYESYHEDPSSKICKPFLAGLCTYGHKCMNRHPSEEEADAVRATYKEKTCSYKDECQTEGCLYWHPWEAAEDAQESVEYAGEISEDTGVPTYEHWLALNCPAPLTMDETHVYNTWHYSGSGMQRDPWEVYCLMYPETYQNTSLNATSQVWEPGNNTSAASQSWEPSNGTHLEQTQDPQTFQEWKKKGQPFPSWFCSDLDPWYDDEGVRRSLEEVYQVLYGENAEENFDLQQQAQSVANDPTPAELAAMISANDPQLETSQITEEQSPARGGWASIAAKPPVPANSIISNSVIASQPSFSQGEGSTKRRMVVIPKEVWLPSTANSDCFHLYPNPIERFKAVNNHHKSYLASVTIPNYFDNNSGSSKNQGDKSNKVALLDVHFQSGKTITPVLNRFLVPALKKYDEAWIVTGSGNHVTVGHQRREGGGVLFNAVKQYLEDHEEEMSLEFCVGKDTSGGKNKSSGGAFLVREKT